jgi:transcription-repair coupling factor (superfamily II helicase)
MSTSTSLSIQSLLTAALARTGLTPAPPRVSGLTAPARALTVAGAAHRSPDDVMVYVVSSDADLDAAVGDVRFFLGALEGLADAVVERAVLPLPSLQVDPYRGIEPHFRVTSARARALHTIAAGDARVIVASALALLPRIMQPERLLALACHLKPGRDIEPEAMVERLVDGGYTRQEPVDEHGEFSLRGGILDIFPANEERPIRIEFIGDTVESIRRFDPSTQRSIETLDQFEIIPVKASPADPHDAAAFATYLDAPKNARFIVAEPGDVRAVVGKWIVQVEASYVRGGVKDESRPEHSPASLFVTEAEAGSWLSSAMVLEELEIAPPLAEPPGPAAPEPGPEQRPIDVDAAGPRPGTAERHVPSQPTQEFHGRIADWIADVRRAQAHGETVVLVASTRGRAERAVELLHDHDIRALPAARLDDVSAGAVIVAEGLLSRGLRLPKAALVLYSESDIFDDERRRTSSTRARSVAATFLSDLRDLKVNDLIVHVDHGIGKFVGLRRISVGHGDIVQEFLELHYHDDAKLFVPVERLDLIQKYSGGARPPLDRLGGTTWEKAKTRVKKAMRDMAEELLKLYAARRASQGHAFAADTHWQEEFEDAFEYELTPDQTTAIADIKRDMESSMPMDRLLCGDVGYGKTEVAMRAAFKAVMDGKQVAVLAPTTVLAFQHLKTLSERFAAFPAKIDMISRFRTPPEIKEALQALGAGRLDVIVGTHRLLSKDVAFHDLGLLVVDEEQRFGVAHKERIKQMRRKVDVLTMTATPIPRTLNMSLVGIRDMSVIETPPKDRLAIQTNVVKFDQAVIVRAVRNELARGGQVFFVHNRVESIYSMGNLLQRLVPEARVVIGHGQMSEEALERAMLDFMGHKFDVLLATTIVENGLDIPNANTIIINRADRYGLSQLYQLRGRVGRSDRPAYAYLLIPPEQSLSPVARKRLAAIREFSDLGSGFRVAALDLEIRGAGNLLGGQQSGHIDAVGFEMYMKLLEDTIRELKGEDLEEDVRATVNLKVDFRIDEAYIEDVNQRLMVYRRVAGARREDDIARIVDEVRDRYGPLPSAMLNLADYARLRVLADGLGIDTVDREGSLVVFKFREKTRVDPVFLIKLVRERGDLQLAPPNAVKLDLSKPGAGGRPDEARSAKVQRKTRQPAWWTARATAGEVSPGFSKAEILRKPEEDPRKPDGVLDRITGFLLTLTHEAD